MWMRVAGCAALALVAAGTAGARALDRGFTAPARVTALDETAAGIATGVAWSPRRCEAVLLWQPARFARYTFRAPGPCPQTSTGRGIASVATDSRRVAWLSYVGGNTREWSLWTATPTARTPRRLRFAAADVDAPPPIVLGNGGEPGIPYAVGRDVVVLRGNGTRALSWRAPARVVALAQGAERVGVLVATGHLYLVPLTHGAATDFDYAPGDVRAFRVVAAGAVVETRTRIELRTTGATTALGARHGAHLAGYADGDLVYTLGGEIRLHVRSSGRDVLLRRARTPLAADFDRRGLAWVSGGPRVCWATRVDVAPGAHGGRC
jgi:hypothetical protein